MFKAYVTLSALIALKSKSLLNLLISENYPGKAAVSGVYSLYHLFHRMLLEPSKD